MMVKNLQPPYFAVIFTTTLTENLRGYHDMNVKMAALAKQQAGFLGLESARAELGITISYWKDLPSIKKWKDHAVHQLAQSMGREKWYQAFELRICKVEKAYGFEK